MIKKGDVMKVLVLKVAILFLFCTSSFFSQNFWQKTSGPAQGRVNSLLVTSSGIFAGANSVYFSSDDGVTWDTKNSGIPVPEKVYQFFLDDSSNIYAGVGNSRIYKTSNGGTEWVAKTVVSGSVDIRSIAMNKNGTMFCGGLTGGGVFRSTDKGETWAASNAGITDFNINALTINSSGHVFAATENGGVFRSTDDGANWIAVNSGLSQVSANNIIAKPNDELICIDGSTQFFLSLNNGDSWTKISPNVTSSARGLVINSLNHIYIAMDMQGVIRSTDNGANWETINSGLDDLFLRSLALDANQRIYLGTSNTRVVYIGQVTATGLERISENSPKDFGLSQNYPNPFNPTTKINYQLSANGFVTLKILDVLGKEVTTLVNDEQLTGTYSVDFDASNLSSGIYFYELRTGSFIQSKKMILLK